MSEFQTGDGFNYSAHGERIWSRCPLPEYSEADASVPPTLSIETAPPLGDLPSEHGFVESEDGYRIWWAGGGDFFISNAGNISARRLPGVSDALFRLPLLGTVLSVAMAMRRRFILHGNAVSIHGKAVIIVGHKGQGKTTLTACLLKRGHRLIADDVSALTLDGASAWVHRGSLQLRLWADSIERIFADSADCFEQFSDNYPKRIVPAQQFADNRERVPLAAILSLCESERLLWEEIPMAEAWREAAAHSFQSRLGSIFLKAEKARWHHGECAKLVRAVKIHRLHRPRDFSRLDDVAGFIEHALAQE